MVGFLATCEKNFSVIYFKTYKQAEQKLKMLKWTIHLKRNEHILKTINISRCSIIKTDIIKPFSFFSYLRGEYVDIWF